MSKNTSEHIEDWQSEHKEATEAYNEFVEEHGCFGDEYADA